MLCLMKAIIGWVVLAYIGTNLTGHVVRGLVHQGLPQEDESETEVLRAEARRERNWDTVFTAGYSCLGVGYLYVLFRWLNWLVALAAFLLLLARLPSLLFELRAGPVYSAQARRDIAMNMPTPIRAFCGILSWSALPILWWGLCKG
jgi:hypothetical protein